MLNHSGLTKLALWGVGTAAILKVSDLPGEYEHCFCGAWG
jgi:hypothetical protein